MLINQDCLKTFSRILCDMYSSLYSTRLKKIINWSSLLVYIRTMGEWEYVLINVFVVFTYNWQGNLEVISITERCSNIPLKDFYFMKCIAGDMFIWINFCLSHKIKLFIKEIVILSHISSSRITKRFDNKTIVILI